MKIFHSTEEVEKEYLPNYFMKRITSDAIEGKTVLLKNLWISYLRRSWSKKIGFDKT